LNVEKRAINNIITCRITFIKIIIIKFW